MSCNCGESYKKALKSIEARIARRRGKVNPEKELEKKLREQSKDKDEKEQ